VVCDLDANVDALGADARTRDDEALSWLLVAEATGLSLTLEGTPRSGLDRPTDAPDADEDQWPRYDPAVHIGAVGTLVAERADDRLGCVGRPDEQLRVTKPLECGSERVAASGRGEGHRCLNDSFRSFSVVGPYRGDPLLQETQVFFSGCHYLHSYAASASG
jgi:hypothetical protein